MAKKEAKAKKENSKNKKSFFKDFKAELKKVNWPTPKQLLNNTIAVVTIVLITAAIVFVLDIAFETLNKHGVDKIKEIVGTNQSVSEDATTKEPTEGNVEAEGEATEENPENSNEENNPENNTENSTENKVE